MQIALVSMMDDNFLPGFIGFYKSVKKNSPSLFQFPWLFIDVGLSDKTKKEMKSYYENIEFIEPAKQNYVKVNFSATNPKLQNTYYTLEVFRLTDYDRLVFIDMDVLVLDDISYLFTISEPLAGVQCYSPSSDSLRNMINTGVFIVNKPFINEEYYRAIIRRCRHGFSMPDQKAINRFFDGKIKFLQKEYNMEKRIIKSKRWNWKKAKILHFVSHKPWDKNPPTGNNVGFEEMEELWREYYNG